MRSLVLSFALLTLPLSGVRAQGARGAPAAPSDTAGAFVDAGAAVLLGRAREARDRTDRSLASYTALVRGRVAAALRTPLKDRTLYRQEAAGRVRWSRDGEHLVQVLAAREQSPGGVSVPRGAPFPLDALFDPAHDRLYFGSMPHDTAGDNDDFWIEHPLADDAERHYRFRSGDTLTISLQGGEVVRVAELQVVPRRDDPHTVRGTLWIDVRSGALVQSAFRLARAVDILRDIPMDDDDARTAGRIPLINPLQFDITLLTVEYSLWNMQHWLPRSMRFDGMVRAGIFRVPASADVSYTMLDVEVDGPGEPRTSADEEASVTRTLAAWDPDGGFRETRTKNNRRDYRILRPQQDAVLLEDETLPPPIWVDAAGFASEAELRRLYDRVAAIAGPQQTSLPVRVGWGLREPGMVRYNRVEALSVGARLTVPLRQATVSAAARIGAGDLHPGIELAARRETMRRTIELRAYHELAAVDLSGRALGAGNSLSALLFGRDEGEYFRATGASLTLAPPATRRRWWDAGIYAERHDAVERNTHIALPRMWADSVFRLNITADEADQVGAIVNVRPWWGSDPLRAQFGMDALVQAEAGDFEHVRGRVVLRGAVPVGGRIRVGAEVGAATAGGSVPVQRHFFLGGASTLRGYEPSIMSGTSMARGRVELARAWPSGSLAVFSDWGWAGDRQDIRGSDALWSLGAGASLLDGLVRVDLARGMRAPRGWRLDLHVDAAL